MSIACSEVKRHHAASTSRLQRAPPWDRTGAKAPSILQILNTPAANLQRSSGSVRFSFKRRGSNTVLDSLYQDGCYKARFPHTEAQQTTEAVLINTAGGLTDGDSLSCIASWQPETSALITTQAAERIYRSRKSHATVHTHLNVGKRANACWLPQEAILFDGGRIKRNIDINISSDAYLFAAESVVFGRTGMGEVTQSGELRDTWRVRIDDKLVFADSLLFDDTRHGHLADHLSNRSIADGANCMATIIIAGTDCATQLVRVRDALKECKVIAGASNLGSLIVARALGNGSQSIRDAIARVFEATQGAADDLSAQRFEMPRVWYC